MKKWIFVLGLVLFAMLMSSYQDSNRMRIEDDVGICVIDQNTMETLDCIDFTFDCPVWRSAFIIDKYLPVSANYEVILFADVQGTNLLAIPGRCKSYNADILQNRRKTKFI